MDACMDRVREERERVVARSSMNFVDHSKDIH